MRNVPKSRKGTELEYTTERIARAAKLAEERHRGQVRKGPEALPYVTHCEEVARLVETHGGDEDAIAAAWLHDIVEDTDTTLEEVEALFGRSVADIVAEVTDDPALDKQAARAEQVRSAPTKSPSAALVKAADQTSNMLSIITTPPYWSRQRAYDYIAKARAVVAGLWAPMSLKEKFAIAAATAE
ncbi:HD domain-containing protein [Rhodobacterales bacterium HKCCSP123]|nr:HD domain-containing protein [Rhodobacterales bacterium HKCCSP123]